VHFGELTPPEQRVLGCLLEKRWTTPDQYPLTLNSLRLACNQSTNRDPVTRYDEDTVREAAQRLCKYGIARLASGHGSRSTKYRHLAEESLGLNKEQLAVLGVLLLRGPQTPGELKTRTERLAQFASLESVEAVLDQLGARGYTRRVERRPGQKEDRFEQLLGGAGDGEWAPAAAAPSYGSATAAPSYEPAAPVPRPVSVPAAAPVSSPVSAPVSRPVSAPVSLPSAPPVSAPSSELVSRVEWLEERLDELITEVAELHDLLDSLTGGSDDGE
jgi:uncharacterized protein YceH (UPF0502 family)